MRTQVICLAIAVVLLCPLVSSQWVKQESGTGNPLYGVDIISQSTGWVVGDRTVDTCLALMTSNSGATWTKQSLSFPWLTLEGVRFVDSSTGIIVGGRHTTGDGGTSYAYGEILRTTDGGRTWCIVYGDTAGYPSNYLTSVTFTDAANGWAVGGCLQIGIPPGSSAVILHTSNGGNTWKVQYTDAFHRSNDAQFQSVCFTDSNNGTVVGGSRILRTTNGGESWARQASWTDTIGAVQFSHVCFPDSNTGLVFSSSPLPFRPSQNILLRTTNAGETWTSQQFSSYVHCAVFSDAHIGVAVGDSGAILRTTDGGATWTNQFSGTMMTLYGVCFTGAYAGTAVGDLGTILRTTNGGVSWVEGQQRSLPQHYLLCQNYPNPFNPRTTIRYELPKASMVRLSVYDMLGREVSVLVNERKNAGAYEVKCDAAGLSSGVYLYRLQAGDFTQIKSLLLLK
jgi:photosystem II stability/assembly factor-like uncharacterized protein